MGLEDNRIRDNEELTTNQKLLREVSDQDLLRLMHRASVITSAITFTYASISLFLPNGKINAVVSSSVGLLFAFVNVFYKLNKLEALKLYFSVAVPLWVMVTTMLIGGDFSQSAAFLTLIAMIYVFYEQRKKLRNFLTATLLCMFIISSLFVKYHGTVFTEIEQPFDEVVVMVIAVIWTYSLLGKRDRERLFLIENLERNYVSLKATTEELERFTYIASHDLKSPLRNISSFIGLIERDIQRGNYSNLLNHIGYARRGAEQMHYLIQGILEVSSINGDIYATKKAHNLGQLLDMAITNLNLEIAERNAEIIHTPLPEYYCNDVEFTLLFQNLIQNGIKYNKSEVPKINISSEASPEGPLRIIFADNGIGIEPKFQDYVFEHFKRLHTSSEYLGTGLGLSLCKKIVEKHHGTIYLDSALGKGSKFIIDLPMVENQTPDLSEA
ncbi:MAG: hypothetical protein GC192_10955 [Bacteroidetes bacterium]|nr:hypothetical protein [Bacteroidota bacterium]